ncbi:MAG TPA: hypothetical protein VGB37_03630 [Candidatus Lokiarchaeia archaeon]
MKEKLTHVEQQLKNFILTNKNFYDLAKKHTFSFRDFSPYYDDCAIKWNNKEQKWDFEGYYLQDENKALPSKSTEIFFLDLNIDGFDWGSLYSELYVQFQKYLTRMNYDDIKEDTEKFEELRRSYFNENKKWFIDNWFKINEENIDGYFKRMLKKIRALKFEQKNRLKT